MKNTVYYMSFDLCISVYVKCSPYEQAPENVNKNLATDALGASRWSNRLSTQEFNSAIQYSASGEVSSEITTPSIDDV